jgi:phosphoribosylformylglycinamidine (FGAM) synthase-like amidotransferase family enzyme
MDHGHVMLVMMGHDESWVWGAWAGGDDDGAHLWGGRCESESM